MSLLTSDYEERVLHFARNSPKPFTVREVARATNVKPSTTARIISTFEDLELVVRVLTSPEMTFRYAPSATSSALKKVQQLKALAHVIKQQRKLEVARDAKYVRRRG
jgi:DNA-binding IclR family transcriptional regulator